MSRQWGTYWLLVGGLAIAAVLLLWSEATGAHPAVVRISNLTTGSICYGSGTLIEHDGFGAVVLTCAHLFRGTPGTIRVTFPDGASCEATIVGRDITWDLAALAIASPPAARPVPIATGHPKSGDPLTSCGYGSDGRYWCNQGRTLGYARTSLTTTYETLELSGYARDGDSGGPVFNASGELVAVLWGTDGRMVGGTYCGRVRKFLAGLLGSGRGGGAVCGPGGCPAGQPTCPGDGSCPQGGMAGNGPPIVGEMPIAKPPQPGTIVPVVPRQPATGCAEEFSKISDRLARIEAAVAAQAAQPTPKPPAEGGAPILADHLDKIRGQLDGLSTRVNQAESAVGEENLRAIVGEIAGTAPPSAISAVLPTILTALGWSTPPSAAVVIGLWLLRRVRASRKNAAKGGAGDEAVRRRPLNDDYAEQLARVYALSGRSPMADVTLGREYDEELRRAAESSDGAIATWARALRDRVASRFYRIHDPVPVPAEPVASPATPQEGMPRCPPEPTRFKTRLRDFATARSIPMLGTA